MEALIKMADRQLIGLQRQQNGLGLAIFDLRALRMQTPEHLKH